MLVSLLTLLTGIGVFIAGMNMMSEGLEKSAGRGMKALLGTISTNRFAGVCTGIAATAIIQSSSATSVIVIGFVNAGIMTLVQACSIIMGANVGTTVTNALVALSGSSFDIDVFMMALAFIGVMMMFIKREKIKNIGLILCGLGVLFVGLDLMSGAFKGGKEITEFFQNLFKIIEFPLLLILVGVVFTALVQSSSAATGIVIIMAGESVIGLDSAMFIVLGATIGTCITSTLASLGAGVNAKRTAFMHLMINVVGTCIFTAIIWPLKDVIVGWLAPIESTMWQITVFHIVYKVLLTIVLLPFVKQIVALAEKAIKEKPTEDEKRKLKYVDDRLLKSPAIALMQVKKEVEYMATLAKQNLELSLDGIITGNEKTLAEVYEREKLINFTNNAVTKYLIKLSPLVDVSAERVIGSYFHVLNDLERVGDHAENFFEIGVQMKKGGMAFSETAKEELREMYKKVFEMFEIAINAFDNLSTEHLAELTAKENEVDNLKKKLNASHVTRLANGDCSMDHSPYFFSAVAGLERVADHLVNVGYSIVNPTGSQSVKA
ncbi:MAG: Na/Pi cotransporter family protein [Clostridia bacterium]|nr:Na/Pi cotransporter family protein [Clostridia bacterium]